MNEEPLNILQKVRILYRKYGIRSVTMDDVSHELGISKKTLYQYVRDKDELVQKVIDLDINERHARIEITNQDDMNAIEQLFVIGRCIGFMLKDYSPASEYDLKKYYPDLYIKVRDRRRDHIYKFIQENLIKGKKEGLYFESIDSEIITKLGVSIIDSMLDNEIITLAEFLDQHFFYEFFKYHVRGIATAKGLNILEQCLNNLKFPL